MSKGFVLLLIVLAVLGMSFWYLVKANPDNSLIQGILKGVRVYTDETPSSSPLSGEGKVPAEFQSGNSRFSRGACAGDATCKPGGCSGEVCSSDPNVVSTCEFSDSFPNVQGYSCGCLPTKVCGWR